MIELVFGLTLFGLILLFGWALWLLSQTEPEDNPKQAPFRGSLPKPGSKK